MVGKNYRVQVKVNKRFLGVQHFCTNNKIIYGGNIFHQLIFRDMTDERAQNLLKELNSIYPDREFKLKPV